MKKLDFEGEDRITLDMLEHAIKIQSSHLSTERIKEILNSLYQRGYTDCQRDLRTVLGIEQHITGW